MFLTSRSIQLLTLPYRTHALLDSKSHCTVSIPIVYQFVRDSTVWVYLFFLPFQLVGQFGYYTIPGVAIASFIYLGFVAAGEEIEQPFGGCSPNLL